MKTRLRLAGSGCIGLDKVIEILNSYKRMFGRVRFKEILLLQLMAMSACVSTFADVCPKGEYWISPYFRNSYVRYDGVLVDSANVRGHCRVNPRGYEKWSQRLSNERPPVWGYRDEKSKKWTAEEAERVYDAIAILPPRLLDLSKVELHRMAKSISKGNPATSNLDNVVLYDLAFKHKASLEQILAHELSHILYYALEKDQRRAFAQSANWKRVLSVPNGWIAKKGKVFVEEDSRLSLVEDFANHVEHYLFYNARLKESSPEAFKWIAKTFGKEFRIQEIK